MGRRGIVAALAVCALVVVPAALALSQIAVRTTRATEIEPTAAPGYLAWSQNSAAHPNRFNVFVKRGGASPARVNPSGSTAFLWGGAIEGDTMVYSQFARGAGTADLKLFNLVTRVRANPPAGVNTRFSENGASLSNEWLLFRRTSFATSTERIILHNVVTHDARLLAVTRGRAYAQPGNVAGDWATWFTCTTFAHCRAHRYNIPAKTQVAVPNPSSRSQYAVSVTDAGTVYFAESGNVNCGAGRGLWRFRQGTRARLFAFGSNQDPAVSFPLVNADGSTSVFYDRFSCRTGASDLYKVVDPGRSDLSLAMTASDPAPKAGDDVAYTIDVGNAGPTTAKAVTVTDTVPAEMQFVSASPGCVESSGVVTCDLGNVQVGATPQVTITLKACTGTTIVNTAGVDSVWVDPNAANNSAGAPVTLSAGGSSCPP